MSSIKAVLQPSPLSPQLELTTLPCPSREGDEHLIRVHATSPCVGELTWEANFPALYASSKRDRVPGTEGAGTVIEAPEGSVFKAGDTVFWRTDAWLTGAAREVTVVPEKYLAHTPKSLSLDIAAATPLSSLTAWQGIFEHGTIDPAAVDGDAAAKEHNAKQRIMITGAAGAVGSWALEFARAAGVGHIIAVCSGAKAEKAKKYGATEVIDYRTSSVPTWAQTNPPVDLIFDCVGGGTIAGLWSAVKDGGVFLSVCANPADTQPASKVVMTAKWFLVEPRGSDLGRIVALIDARSFEPQIDSVVPFEQFAEAWAKVDAGKTNGKVVVKVA